MKNKRIISALIGLAGAIQNNGKTSNTDGIVAKVLLLPDSDEVVDAIHKEKFVISPNCETCMNPCGNTSDFEICRWEQEEESTRSFKQQIAQKLYEIAEGYLNGEKKELPDGFYKAISFLGYELIEEYYQKLLEEMNEW